MLNLSLRFRHDGAAFRSINAGARRSHRPAWRSFPPAIQISSCNHSLPLPDVSATRTKPVLFRDAELDGVATLTGKNWIYAPRNGPKNADKPVLSRTFRATRREKFEALPLDLRGAPQGELPPAQVNCRTASHGTACGNRCGNSDFRRSGERSAALPAAQPSPLRNPLSIEPTYAPSGRFSFLLHTIQRNSSRLRRDADVQAITP